jgi:hypothetical protein
VFCHHFPCAHHVVLNCDKMAFFFCFEVSFHFSISLSRSVDVLTPFSLIKVQEAIKADQENRLEDAFRLYMKVLFVCALFRSKGLFDVFFHRLSSGLRCR